MSTPVTSAVINVLSRECVVRPTPQPMSKMLTIGIGPIYLLTNLVRYFGFNSLWYLSKACLGLSDFSMALYEPKSPPFL